MGMVLLLTSFVTDECIVHTFLEQWNPSLFILIALLDYCAS